MIDLTSPKTNPDGELLYYTEAEVADIRVQQKLAHDLALKAADKRGYVINRRVRRLLP